MNIHIAVYPVHEVDRAVGEIKNAVDYTLSTPIKDAKKEYPDIVPYNYVNKESPCRLYSRARTHQQTFNHLVTQAKRFSAD